MRLSVTVDRKIADQHGRSRSKLERAEAEPQQYPAVSATRPSRCGTEMEERALLRPRVPATMRWATSAASSGVRGDAWPEPTSYFQLHLAC